ncbi:MAG: hypothetical protein QY317_16325 [Candidatus Jettenia caeni]|nr:MAG: hypothetical protein QY317_16325 [Candidatus Jettenia caeni]
MAKNNIGLTVSCIFIVVILFITVADAQQVTRKFDNFYNTHNTECLSQFIIAGRGGDVTFTKRVSKQFDSQTYILKFKMKNKEESWHFTYDGIELRIGENKEIQSLNPNKVDCKFINTQNGYTVHHSWAEITVRQNIIDLLKTARSAVFKITFSDQGECVWEVPWNILRTWQQIIELN